MARRKEGLVAIIVAMPWPFGIATGIVGFIATIHYGIERDDSLRH